MSTIVTTPVRERPSPSADYNSSNESPLPTPPRAMHDLIRNGRWTGRTSQPHLDEDEPTVLRTEVAAAAAGSTHRQSSSPTTNARSAGEGRASSMAAGGRGSPSGTLSASMGTSIAHRQALGSQMGIHSGGTSAGHAETDKRSPPLSSSSSAFRSTSNVLRTSTVNRPGLLQHDSQRSSSYESATTQSASHNGKSARPASEAQGLSKSHFLHSGGSTATRDKENVDHRYHNDDAARPTVNAHSTMRRSMTRATQSPSPSEDNFRSSAAASAFSRSTYRRTSGEEKEELNGKPALAGSVRVDRDASRRVSDEGEAATLLHKSHARLKEEEEKRTNESSTGRSALQQQQHEQPLQTPSMNAGSRVLRAGQARPTAAPWSVGRSIKRIDRHLGPEKPPQRVVAQIHEQDDDEDEYAMEQDFAAPVESVSGSRSHRKSGGDSDSGKNSGSNSSGERQSNGIHRVDKAKENARQSSAVDEMGLASEQDRLLHVPLGADEDEEEEDIFNELAYRAQNGRQSLEPQSRRPVRGAPGVDGAPVPSTPFDLQAQRRRLAINDIMAAKVPADAGPRRILTQTIDHVAPSKPIAASAAASEGDEYGRLHGTMSQSSSASSADDFITLVRREARRQSTVEFIEQLRLKPSKDLDTKFNGYKFKKVRKAGEGGFSTVWIVHGPFAAPDPHNPGSYVDVPEEDQAYFAMKQVTLKKMEQVSREEVMEECNLLHMLASKPDNEDFILRFFGWKSSTGSLKILLELGEHDFNQILRAHRLSHEQIVTYWYQMVQAVHFTHEQGNIVHTDLKPANFLMANGRLKLIDFGIAQKIPVGTIHIKRDAMIGTPNYMAPETVRAVKEGRNGRAATPLATPSAGPQSRVYKAGKASDVWALGCILYQMVYSRPPFEAFHGDDKLREILDPNHRIEFTTMRYGPPPPRKNATGEGDEADIENDDENDDDDYVEPVDGQLIHLLRLTLTYNAAERITIPQLLQHPLLRPLEEERLRAAAQRRRGQAAEGPGGTAAADEGDDHDGETVPMSRKTLRDILHKMYAFARNGELHEDNLDARADALFDNMLVRNRQRTQYVQHDGSGGDM